MKKLIVTLMLVLSASLSFAGDTYITIHNNGGHTHTRTTTTYHGGGYNPDRYYSDYKADEWFSNKTSDITAHCGLLTRFGYGFNYDAFTYGASLLYHWDGVFGITAGFDGYAFNAEYVVDDITYKPSSIPLWDVRLGFELGRYFAFGGLIGKFNYVDGNGKAIQIKDNHWFCNDDGTLMYGGFVTFVMPIGKYFGFNIDFAVTNKTGFNLCGGINFTFPVK